MPPEAGDGRLSICSGLCGQRKGRCGAGHVLKGGSLACPFLDHSPYEKEQPVGTESTASPPLSALHTQGTPGHPASTAHMPPPGMLGWEQCPLSGSALLLSKVMSLRFQAASLPASSEKSAHESHSHFCSPAPASSLPTPQWGPATAPLRSEESSSR